MYRHWADDGLPPPPREQQPWRKAMSRKNRAPLAGRVIEAAEPALAAKGYAESMRNYVAVPN